MSSKEQPHKNEKIKSKQSNPNPNSKELETIAHQSPIGNVIQRAIIDPQTLTPSDLQQLHRTIGHQAVSQFLDQSALQQPLQKKEVVQSELPKPKLTTLQRQEKQDVFFRQGEHSLAPKPTPNPENVVQRVYLDQGQKVTDDAFTTIISGVEVISFANRHTILGLLQNKGGAKGLNTVLLKPIEMQLVAHDAYECAWNAKKGRVSVEDGTTFVSSGIKWGIDARPNQVPPSIHIYPTEGGGKTIDIGSLIPSLRAFLGMVEKGASIQDATTFAVKICDKLGQDSTKLRVVIIALQNMGEI